MPRRGNQMGQGVPGTTYPCAPGGPNDYVFITAQQQMWPAMAEAMGQPELAEDPRFNTTEMRWENRDALNATIEEWTRGRSKHEVMRILGEAGVPCGACQDTGEVLADPHLKAREMIVDVDYPTRGTYQTVGCPIKLSDSPCDVQRSPLLGEHTQEILTKVLGYSAAEIAEIKGSGAITPAEKGARAEAAQTLRTIRPAASTVRVSLRLMWVQAGVATAPSACGASDRLPLGDRRAGVVERGPVEVGDRRLACETECGVDVGLHHAEHVADTGLAAGRHRPRPRAPDEDRPRAHRDARRRADLWRCGGILARALAQPETLAPSRRASARLP